MFRITRLLKFIGAQCYYGSLARGESNGIIFSILVQPKAGTNAPKFGVFCIFSPYGGWASAILKESRMIEKFNISNLS